MPSPAALPEVHVPQCRTLQSTDLPRPQSRSDSAQIREPSRAQRNEQSEQSLKEAVHTLKARVLSDTLNMASVASVMITELPLVPSPKTTADLPSGQRCPDVLNVSSFLQQHSVHQCHF
jgi:hypothetical protein